MNMMKNPLAATALAIALVAVPIRQSSPPESSTSPPDIALLEEVEGQGFWGGLVCAGCVMGGVGLAFGGWGAILVAAAAPNSSLVLAGCIGACVSAF